MCENDHQPQDETIYLSLFFEGCVGLVEISFLRFSVTLYNFTPLALT